MRQSCGLAMLVLLTHAALHAADPTPKYEMGQKLMPKDGCKIVNGNRVTPYSEVEWPVRVSGFQNGWIYIGPEGYVHPSTVLTLDEAIPYYTAKLRMERDDPGFYYARRAITWEEKGELDIAIGDYGQLIRLDPTDPYSYNNRGCLWMKKSDFDRAVEDFNEAIRLDPEYGSAFSGRGQAFALKQNYDQAIDDLSEAIRFDPQDSENYAHRGHTLFLKHEYAGALKDFERAMRLDSTDHLAWSYSAFLYATSVDPAYRDGSKALEHATKACELTSWNDPACLDAMAAAYAETGDFDQAVETQEKAIKLAERDKDKQDFRDRLKLYQEKKPFRQEG